MHRIRLSLVIAVLTAVLVAPMAEARSLGFARPGARAESSWLTAAMSWLEELVGWRPASRSGASAPPSSKGGTCIDPQGNPIPCLR